MTFNGNPFSPRICQNSKTPSKSPKARTTNVPFVIGCGGFPKENVLGELNRSSPSIRIVSSYIVGGRLNVSV